MIGSAAPARAAESLAVPGLRAGRCRVRCADRSLPAETVPQQIGEHVAALGQAQAGELHHEPAIVLIDDAAGQSVRLAEDQPARLPGPHHAQDVLPQMQWPPAAVAEESLIERHVGP